MAHCNKRICYCNEGGPCRYKITSTTSEITKRNCAAILYNGASNCWELWQDGDTDWIRAASNNKGAAYAIAELLQSSMAFEEFDEITIHTNH